MADTKTQSAAGKPQKEDKLRAFLIELATQSQRLGEFIEDPDAAMEAADVEAEDQALLKSGNATAINARVSGKVTAKAPPPLLLVHLQDDGTPSVQEGYGAGTSNYPQPMVYPQPMPPPSQWQSFTPRPRIWAALFWEQPVPAGMQAWGSPFPGPYWPVPESVHVWP